MNPLKTLSIAAALATAALAAGCDTMHSMGSRLRGDTSASASSESLQRANTYWAQHEHDGYMSRADTMSYLSTDDRRIDFSQIDADRDGRISGSEWQAYERMAR